VHFILIWTIDGNNLRRRAEEYVQIGVDEEDQDEKGQGVDSVVKAGSGTPEGFFLCLAR